MIFIRIRLKIDPFLYLKKDPKQPAAIIIKMFLWCNKHIAKVCFRSIYQTHKRIIVRWIFFFYHLACDIKRMNIVICGKSIVIGIIQQDTSCRNQIIWLQFLFQFSFGKNLFLFIQKVSPVMTGSHIFRLVIVLPDPVQACQFTVITIQTGNILPGIITKIPQILFSFTPYL